MPDGPSDGSGRLRVDLCGDRTRHGRQPDITLGKPDPNMLSGILQRHSLQPGEIAMVGDRIYTDIEMAYNAGALGVLVLSGETTLDMAEQAPRQPQLIVEHIGVLGELLREAHEKDRN